MTPTLWKNPIHCGGWCHSEFAPHVRVRRHHALRKELFPAGKNPADISRRHHAPAICGGTVCRPESSRNVHSSALSCSDQWQ